MHFDLTQRKMGLLMGEMKIKSGLVSNKCSGRLIELPEVVNELKQVYMVMFHMIHKN